uniref:Uncharacterized protein n=1 Tax=Arundo donax TaxID=35708 RepID=A0A0A9GR01_ARUDO
MEEDTWKQEQAECEVRNLAFLIQFQYITSLAHRKCR